MALDGEHVSGCECREGSVVTLQQLAIFLVGVGAHPFQTGKVDVDGVGGGAIRGRWAGPGAAHGRLPPTVGVGALTDGRSERGFPWMAQRGMVMGISAGFGVAEGVGL